MGNESMKFEIFQIETKEGKKCVLKEKLDNCNLSYLNEIEDEILS